MYFFGKLKISDKLQTNFLPRIFFWLVVFLTTCGLVASSYLSFTHYRNFSDIAHRSFCAISRSLNCDTVAQSPYAVFLNVPVAVWGLFAYLLFLALVTILRPRGQFFPSAALCCLLAALFSLTSIGLAVVSTLHIHSYCVFCLLTYAVNFGLFLVCYMAQSRFGAGSFVASLKQDLAYLRTKPRQVLAVAGCSLALAVAALLFYPRYWQYEPLPVNTRVEQGVTEDGSPWIGARNPVLTITEYADYLCFQCGKMHHHLRQLVNQYPERIRLVHRHFPLDDRVNPMAKETVHANAGLLALFAIMAQEQDLFWPVSDALFREARNKQAISFSAIARETGMDLSRFQEQLKDTALHKRLSDDIRAGLALHLTATPSYVIDGTVYSGTIPESVLLPALKNN